MGYTYPVLGSLQVPRRRLGHARTLLSALAGMAVLVILITVVAVLVSPSTQGCHFSCGPLTGSRLAAPQSYTSSDFHYQVGYPDSLSVQSQDADTVTLSADDGDVEFIGARGSDPGSANQNAINNLDTSQLQNLQEIGPIPGAEVGFVAGQGVAYSAQYIPSDGSQGGPVSIMVISAAQNNLTITAIALAGQDNSSPDTNPFLMDAASSQAFDYALANTIWPTS